MTPYRLSGAVMTHPKRRPAAERLARSAPPGALRVVMDPDPAGRPSVLRTALCAWEAIEDGATHHLVVQDDMILSETFFARVRAAIAEMPDAALALFALWDSRNGAAVRFGAMAGARWVGAVNEYFPCVAIVLPRHVASGFVTFGRRHLDSWPDDILMNRYLRAHGIPSYVSVPSLAEHEDHGSISGNAFRGPRRSVCFLPKDTPGRENTRLTGLRVLPFFKHGVAQCAVRAEEPAHGNGTAAHRGSGPGHWLHLDCEQYLEGSGIRAERLQPDIVRMTEAATTEVARGTWLTAFTMGLVQRRAGLRCDPTDGGTTTGPGPHPDPDPEPDPAVLAEALATVGPGGISYAQPEERIAELRDELARITLAGVEAGREEAERMRRSRSGRGGACEPRRTTHTGARGTEARRVGVLGAGTPLGAHLVRGLTDAGHQVTPLDRRPAGPPAAGALLDLTALTAPTATAAEATKPTPAADATSAHRTLTLELPDHPGGFTLRLGDLYGPGCPHHARIGRLVWDALRSYPLTIEDPAEALRPLHTSDLVAGLSSVLRTPPPERAVSLADAPVTAAELAEAIRTAVRPVPLAPAPRPPRPAAEEAAWPPPPPGWKPTTGLTYGLHTYAQWLAYEGIHLVLEV